MRAQETNIFIVPSFQTVCFGRPILWPVPPTVFSLFPLPHNGVLDLQCHTRTRIDIGRALRNQTFTFPERPSFQWGMKKWSSTVLLSKLTWPSCFCNQLWFASSSVASAVMFERLSADSDHQHIHGCSLKSVSDLWDRCFSSPSENSSWTAEGLLGLPNPVITELKKSQFLLLLVFPRVWEPRCLDSLFW